MKVCREIQVKNEKEIWRPKLHFTPKKGWMNDPNGLVFFQGNYHLFYQYNPFSCNWDTMHWGHSVSDDMVSWEEKEIALFPDKPYDNGKEGGCFSGSAVVSGGKLYLFYTGVAKKKGRIRQTQCVAWSEDGEHFEKYENNPVIAEAPEGNGADFRDPKVFFGGGKWRMAVGGSDGPADCPQSRGRIYLYASEDLLQWDYQGILYEADEEEGSMFECPDVYELEGKWVVTASPMNRKDLKQNIYMVGSLDFEQGIFTPEKKGVLDGGTHYYAVQAYQDKEGRTISAAWLGVWQWMPWMRGFGSCDREGYRGVLSVMREMYLDEEQFLCSRISSHIKAGLSEYMEVALPEYMETVKLQETGKKTGRYAIVRQQELIWLKGTMTSGKERHVKERDNQKENRLYLRESKEETVILTIHPEKKCVSLDFTNADKNSRMGIKTMDFEWEEKELDFELLIDRSVVTILLCHGRYAMTSVLYPETGKWDVEAEKAERNHIQINEIYKKGFDR